MTGEITLSGNVLPVGGIKEKVLAAKRAGVHDVILPADNRTNVEEDLTPEQLQGLTPHYVKTIDEVLEIALPSSSARRAPGRGRAGEGVEQLGKPPAVSLRMPASSGWHFFLALHLLYTSRLRNRSPFIEERSSYPYPFGVLLAARATTLTVVSRATPGTAAKSARPKPKVGLRAWMERVLEECDRAAVGFDADPVHDLRVALRRCRSLADGLIALDSDPSWKEMKKAGRKLFRALGELRDMQVMEEWIEKLSVCRGTRADAGSTDPVAQKLLDHIHAREAECKQLAWKDLEQFDRKRWRQWSRTLPGRAARVRQGSAVYLHLALEKWTAAYELHKRAMRTRSQVALHELRIGIKRFRYMVENFLPQQHARWGDDLKELQDLLGEVHDLDVLWATALAVQAFPDIGEPQALAREVES